MDNSYRPCECSGPGYFQRFKRKVDEKLYNLCKESPRHRMLLDEIAGNANFGMIKSINPPEGSAQTNLPKVPKRVVEAVNRNNTPIIDRLRGVGKVINLKENNLNIKSVERQGVDMGTGIGLRHLSQAVEELQKEGIKLEDLQKPVDQGLGDTIERVLTKFGLTKELIKSIAGRSCGCNSRKSWYNSLFSYTKKE